MPPYWKALGIEDPNKIGFFQIFLAKMIHQYSATLTVDIFQQISNEIVTFPFVFQAKTNVIFSGSRTICILVPLARNRMLRSRSLTSRWLRENDVTTREILSDDWEVVTVVWCKCYLTKLLQFNRFIGFQLSMASGE